MARIRIGPLQDHVLGRLTAFGVIKLLKLESIKHCFLDIKCLGGISLLIIFTASCVAPQQTPTANKPTSPAPEVVAQKSLEQIFQAKMQKAKALDLGGKTNEAFQAYMDLLANGTTREGLLQRIIAVVKKMNPPPPVPKELRKQLVFAKTASDEAKDNAGYDRAIAEYRKAVKLAPWVADIYLNLALVQEKRRNYKNAVAGLQLFLDLSPNDPQRQLVQDKIYEMEFMSKEIVRRQKDATRGRQACLDACGNITQSGVGIVRDQQHCVEMFGSFGYGLTPTRHRRQVECQNLVRNNEACKARC